MIDEQDKKVEFESVGSLDASGAFADLASSVFVNNADSAGPTLFLFPETTGFAAVYSTALASIPLKTVAFGFINWGMPLGDDSIEKMASTYIDQILRYQKDGPYFLMGWSSGGYLALEAAIQLKSAGKSVALVMMFDTNAHRGPLEIPQWRSGLDHLLTIYNDRDAWLTQFTRVNALISDYDLSSKPYKGKVILVKALRGRPPEEHPPPEDPQNGWLPYLPQIEVQGFDSFHRQMFDSQNGPLMGGLMCKAVKEAGLM